MAGEIFADLHNHTRASDGDFSPRDLVMAARDQGIKALGITDHDTLSGLEKGLAAGDEHGVEVIPGVEVSIRFEKPYFTGTLHLLCYFLREKLFDQAFVAGFEKLLSLGRGEGLVRARIERINKVFGPGAETALLERDMEFGDIASYAENASRRHFALALAEKFDIKDKGTINRVIGNNSPAYLPSGIELEAAAGFIKDNPVIPVLAHPGAGSFPGKGHYKEVLPPIETVERLLPEFLGAGLRGVEVFYPGHTRELEQELLSWARKHNLLITGGSDCHDNSERPPGVRGVSEIQFTQFKEELECEDKKSR